MTLEEIRKLIIKAISSDEVLMGLFVFKGGNALEIIHKIGQRSSLDMDFSISGDIDNAQDIGQRLFDALSKVFQSVGIVIFDTSFFPRPRNRAPGSRWGGFIAEFKLIDELLFDELNGGIDSIRRQSIESGPGHQRKFKLDISAFEYCDGSKQYEIDGNCIYVYTIDMIAVEKLRAICQQSQKYPLRRHPTPRARDFYDIYASITEGSVDFSSEEIHDLINLIFDAKSVEIDLIKDIHKDREFHRSDWPDVQIAVRYRLRQFDYYFDFVLGEIEKLNPLWIK